MKQKQCEKEPDIIYINILDPHDRRKFQAEMCCLFRAFVLCYGRQCNDFNVILLTMIFISVKRFRNSFAHYEHLINSLCHLLDLFSDSSLRRSKVVQIFYKMFFAW